MPILAPTSLPADAIEVGRIADAWGIKGWFKVHAFSSAPEALFAAKDWFLQPAEKGAKQFTGTVVLPVKQARFHSDTIVATSPEVADRNTAEALRGARIFVAREHFPKTDDGEYYWVDLLGLEVSNREGVVLGKVTDLMSTGPQTVLVVGYELDGKDGKWGLLYEFARLAKGTRPDVITMENVPTVAKHEVFHDFVDTLKRLGYNVWFDVVDSSQYGVPQTRRRMVLLASRHGDIRMIEPTIDKPKTVRQAIGRLRALSAGEAAPRDKLHVSSTLSEKNLKRIKVSKPGGTWRDWPEHLVADCHRAESGRTYPGVYGRMEWDKPAPTMTTQCYGFGNGRFGHPEQDRAITLREAAIIQSFPRDYAFIPDDGEVSFKVLGRLIGNAVPVDLGRAIARSINSHLAEIAPQP